jgi:hypothetical protein
MSLQKFIISYNDSIHIKAYKKTDILDKKQNIFSKSVKFQINILIINGVASSMV